MTRIEMEAVINGGGVVLFNGKRYTTIESLPTQEEIDAVYATGDNGPVVASVDAVGTTVEEIANSVDGLEPSIAGIATSVDGVESGIAGVDSKLPAALHADGGFKVHLQNPGDIAGGGGGTGGGLTNTELRAAPVPTAVSNFPAVQPVSDNGGSLTVDTPQLPAALDGDGGMKVHVQNPTTPLTDTQLRASAVPVSVGNFPATQPVSGPLTDAQLRASAVPISNAAIGSTTDAEATGDGTNIGILKRLRTLAGNIITLLGAGLPASLGGSGGVKVDVLSGAGGVAMGAEVLALAAVSRTTTTSTADITNTGFKGILVHFTYSGGTPANVSAVSVEEKNPATGLYNTLVQTTVATANTLNFNGRILIYPGVSGTNSAQAAYLNGSLPRTFRVTLIYQSATAVTASAYYTLLP